MSELKEKLRSDLTEAIRSRDETRKATLRMVLAAMTTAEVSGSAAAELSDDDVIAILTKEYKRRAEAAEAFRSGGREESAANEEAEAAIIAEYLPQPLTDDELANLVEAAIAESGATSPRDMGAVMTILRPQTTGRADGKKVADAVKAKLIG